MYTYILGHYWSQKRNRNVEVFWGPFDIAEAESIALKYIVSQQGDYKLIESRYRTRAQARQEMASNNITAGGGTLDDALTRYSTGPDVEGAL